ncbi:MAG: trypsin-like peptidase domain-containing protein [Ignavibacteria bacterium]|nr:trypsin-like peptidase domain-containing protein [Ignavibacteria bacterium]
MITSNVITRVFHFNYKGNIGTCFTIDIDNKRYFVTAKHIIEDMKDYDIIELFQKDWKSYSVKLVGHSTIADVSVFTSDHFFDAFPLLANPDKIYFGQDVFYLGFPFEYKSNIGKLNRGFPMPLVKKGIISAISIDNEDGKRLIIDSISARGFSGSPVITADNINFVTDENKKLNYKVVA